LLREPRRALHARIVEALQALVPDIATTRPEALAHHCVEAGQIERGAKLWGTGGQQACVRSANTEAETMLRRALALIERLPSTSETRRDEIAFQIALMNALCVMHGWAAAPANEATERARLLMEQAESLGDTLENPLALYAILYGIWVRYRVDFDGAQILALGQELLSLAERSKNVSAIALGRALLCIAQVETGASDSARTLLELAIAELKLLNVQIFINLFNFDFLSYAYVTSSFASYLLGYQDTCSQFADASINFAQEHGHIPTMVVNYWCCVPMRFLTGSKEKLLNECAAAARLGVQANAPYFAISDNLPIILLNSCDGDSARALQSYHLTQEIFRPSGFRLYTSFYLTFVAQAYMRLGDFAAARACIREALDHVEQKQERWFEADVYRMAGEIARQAPEHDELEAETCFERALAVARSQKARSLELRTATSLARLWRDQGKQAEAHNLLAPVYNWFTEGFDKPDLKAAKALLDELAA
jgi:tetratricopeptide (TPR) repeat protein